MAEPTTAELKELLLGLATKLTTVEADMSTMKVDQARLHVAVNNAQSKRMDGSESSTGPGNKDKHSAGSFSSSITTVPPHKLRFPAFDGTADPITWLHRCDQFFRQAHSSDEDKVWLATYHMEGIAQQWYYALERNQGVLTWPRFVEFVNLRLGPPTRSNPLGELVDVRRTGSVADYQERYLTFLAR